MKEIISRSEDQTIAIARDYASRLPGKAVIFLEGDLGAGKSVFARALIRALTGDENLSVPSPTFTLLQNYETHGFPIWHYDLYRLKDPEEMEELSWDDALSDGIVLIEWPDRLDDRRPLGITVKIETLPGDPTARKITFLE